MPTRKQRRRREKEQRHEYEYVLLDEEGQEHAVDPAELKPAKAERNGTKDGKDKSARGKDRRGRPIREVKPPSWRAAAKRGVLFVVALAVFLSFVGGKKQSLVAKIAIPIAYGVIGIPFFYWMDSSAYRRYLRATGRESEIPKRR
jgi:hypothetical protein